MPRTFETEREGRVLTVRFDNPPLNFMDRVMVAELDELLGWLDGERSLGSVILTGKPEGLFLTHYDIEEILSGSEGVGRTHLRWGGGRLPRDRRRRGSTPGRTGGARAHSGIRPARTAKDPRRLPADAANGQGVHRSDQRARLAGGCELSLACDLRYMAAGAGRFGLPEMTLGFCPGGRRHPAPVTDRRSLPRPGAGPRGARAEPDRSPRRRPGASRRPRPRSGRCRAQHRRADGAPRATLRRGREESRPRRRDPAAARWARRGTEVVHGRGLPAGGEAGDARLPAAASEGGTAFRRPRRAGEVAGRHGGGPGQRGLSGHATR